jgi:copper homeostasis protein
MILPLVSGGGPSKIHMSKPDITLEICAGSLACALAAQEGGADRVELCDNLKEGGTTPSYGTLSRGRDLLDIQLYPIIRPRGGDFLYDEKEFEVMCRDVGICRQLGCDGVAIGLLDAEGAVDVKRTRLLVELAWPMGVTFHRAFDRSRDAFAALEDIIGAGCERILTSGQRPTAPEGAPLIASLVDKAGDRISIMAGSGVLPDNIGELVTATGAREYHSTAKVRRASRMRFVNPAMGETADTTVTDAGVVRRLREEAVLALGKGSPQGS